MRGDSPRAGSANGAHEQSALQTFIVLAFDPSGTCLVMCDILPDDSPAVRCFLSPLDALIDVRLATFRHESFEIASVVGLDRNAIHDGAGEHVVACIHHAWIAKGDHMLLRTRRPWPRIRREPGPEDEKAARAARRGALRFVVDAATWDRPVAEARRVTSLSDGSMLRFDLDAATLTVLDQTYEQAGLFAWRDTLQQVYQWDPARLHESATCAIRRMPRGTHATVGIEQFMLFDPEFGQFFQERARLLPCGAHLALVAVLMIVAHKLPVELLC